MVAVNVWIVGVRFDRGSEIRSKINEILQAGGNAHGSVTTIVTADVKCAENPEKDEPYLRIYSEDPDAALQLADDIGKALKMAVEVAELEYVYVPPEN